MSTATNPAELPRPPRDPIAGPGARLLHPLRPLRRIAWPVLAAAALAGLVAAGLWPEPLALALAAAASALAVAGLAARTVVPSPARSDAADLAALSRLHGADPDRLLLTDRFGRALPGPRDPPPGGTIDGWLDGWCADPAQTRDALLDELARQGSALRGFRRGRSRMDLHLHPLDDAGGASPGRLLWRLSAGPARQAQPGLDETGLPVLTLGDDGTPPRANPALEALLAAGSGSAGADPLGDLVARVQRDLTAGPAEVALALPGGRAATALALPRRDGARQILFLPARPPPAGAADHEDIPVALVTLDGEGRIVGSNRAARSLMGLGPTEDRFLWEVVEGLGRPVAEWLKDARAGRTLNRPEILRAISAREETFVQIILRRAADTEGSGALLAVVSDATELKSLEARFVQSQKMQAIGQLAGGVAHDFNNLLTAITGHCDLLLMGRDPFDADYADLMQIHQNANRAAALVRQLLAFSRKQALQPETLLLEDLLEDVVHLLTRLVGERITLTLHHDPALPAIRADRRQLEQVIVNLVVNARDAMPMGGEIRIETEALTMPADRVIGRVRLPAGHYATIRVIDKGVGIAPDLLDKIFEPFFTTKRQGEGTGLGLSTAYGIVKQMGGYIFVDSVEGAGSTFSLYFGAEASPGGRPAGAATGDAGATDGIGARWASPPSEPRAGESVGAATDAPPVQRHRPAPAWPAPAWPDPAWPDPRPPAGRQPLSRAPSSPPADDWDDHAGVVLLVEDEPPVRAFAARALRLQGYRVLEAQDGEQALEVLADATLAVDIFVTDVIMPGLDGPGWVTQALRDRPGTPVVFVSGYIEDSLSEALGRTPHSVFLEKPFSLEQLSRTIAGQLGSGPS